MAGTFFPEYAYTPYFIFIPLEWVAGLSAPSLGGRFPLVGHFSPVVFYIRTKVHNSEIKIQVFIDETQSYFSPNVI